jgi:hypothetical protein
MFARQVRERRVGCTTLDQRTEPSLWLLDPLTGAVLQRPEVFIVSDDYSGEVRAPLVYRRDYLRRRHRQQIRAVLSVLLCGALTVVAYGLLAGRL